MQKFLAVLMVTVAGPLAAHAECAPAPMTGNDWSSAVATREADCVGGAARSLAPGFAPGRAITPVPVSIYDPRVRFAFDSAELLPEALPTLDRLAAFLASPEGANRAVRVEGHTDATGAGPYNLALSGRRADAVRAYLMGRGIAAARLQSIGFGMTQPLPGLDPHAAENRRVQFRISPG